MLNFNFPLCVIPEIKNIGDTDITKIVIHVTKSPNRDNYTFCL